MVNSTEPTAVVLIADGTEELEAIAAADALCRCGVGVVVASIGSAMPIGRNGLPLRADMTLEALTQAGRSFDAVVVPGGLKGAEMIAADQAARALILSHAERGAVIAAICAAPAVVLAPLGLLEGKRATCYPGMESGLSGATHAEGDVVRDGALITSRGPGTAVAFGLAIGTVLAGEDAAREAASGMLV